MREHVAFGSSGCERQCGHSGDEKRRDPAMSDRVLHFPIIIIIIIITITIISVCPFRRYNINSHGRP